MPPCRHIPLVSSPGFPRLSQPQLTRHCLGDPFSKPPGQPCDGPALQPYSKTSVKRRALPSLLSLSQHSARLTCGAREMCVGRQFTLFRAAELTSLQISQGIWWDSPLSGWCLRRGFGGNVCQTSAGLVSNPFPAFPLLCDPTTLDGFQDPMPAGLCLWLATGRPW